MITEVSGVRMMPANAAPIPTSAYAPGPAVTSGKVVVTPLPTRPPSIAPMNRLGPKMPPALPDE